MAVFTPLDSTQIQALLTPEQLQLVSFSAASEGIENSNFFVTALDAQGRQKELVLTILEQLDFTAGRWFQSLLNELASAGLPVPKPLGQLQTHADKPVVLAPRLPGQHPTTPSPAQAQAIGRTLAQLHISRFRTPSPVIDERARLQQLAAQLPQLPNAWQQVASQLLDSWHATEGERCLIHGDLFRDNSLFVGEALSGLLDFYNASFELPVYDLAVVLNDWALDEQARPHPKLEQALLDGYQQVSPLPTPELLALALAVAALRFWLSRLAGQQKTASAGRSNKQAEEFAAKLALRWAALKQQESAG